MSSVRVPKAPLPDAPPIPATPPLPDAPQTPPLPQVTAGKSGLPPFARLRGKGARKAPLAPIAQRAQAKGEKQRETVETAKAVQQATQKPSNVTPIRPDVQPAPAPKPKSKAQEMRDKMGDVFGEHVRKRIRGMPNNKREGDAADLVRQYGAIYGRKAVDEYHGAGIARLRELLEAERSGGRQGGMREGDFAAAMAASHGQVEQARQQGKQFTSPMVSGEAPKFSDMDVSAEAKRQAEAAGHADWSAVSAQDQDAYLQKARQHLEGTQNG